MLQAAVDAFNTRRNLECMTPEAILAKAEAMLVGKLNKPECMQLIRVLQLRESGDNKVLEKLLSEVKRSPGTYFREQQSGPSSNAGPVKISTPESTPSDRANIECRTTSAPECVDTAALSSSAPSNSRGDIASISRRSPSLPEFIARHEPFDPLRLKGEWDEEPAKQKRGLGGVIRKLFKRV
jgi:hypothetical protein